MKFAVEFNPEFYSDIEQAFDWYNEKQSGLGDKFITAVKQQTEKLSTSPLHFAVKYDNIRCMNFKKFPYLLHYRVDEELKIVRVEALFHTSRNPNIWNKRIHNLT
jgi:hypothetical protein